MPYAHATLLNPACLVITIRFEEPSYAVDEESISLLSVCVVVKGQSERSFTAQISTSTHLF